MTRVRVSVDVDMPAFSLGIDGILAGLACSALADPPRRCATCGATGKVDQALGLDVWLTDCPDCGGTGELRRWKVHGVTITNVSEGTVVARMDGAGREFVRVDKETGEVLG